MTWHSGPLSVCGFRLQVERIRRRSVVLFLARRGLSGPPAAPCYVACAAAAARYGGFQRQRARTRASLV